MQVVGGDGAALVRPRVAPVADVFAQAAFGAPRLVGNAARLVADRWPADTPAPAGVEQQAAPDIAWVAWLGVAADPAPRSRGRFTSARRMQSRKLQRSRPCRRPHDRLALPPVRAGVRPASSPRRCATRQSLSQLHRASFHRGWGQGEFETMLAERNTFTQRLMLGRTTIGFIISRMAADEAEILSVAVAAASAGAAIRAHLLANHLGHLAGRGIRRVFLEVEENNRPPCGSISAPAFRLSAAGNSIIATRAAPN